MKYSKRLRERFPEIKLNPEDLFVLESSQIHYLQDRVPKKEFSAFLHAYPYIKRFLIMKNPVIEDFINKVLKEHKAILDIGVCNAYCQELLWEIGDLIIYNKYPDLFDKRAGFTWKIEEIISTDELKGKIVADIGAGSGKLTFILSEYAKIVYAVEPLTSFRKFMKEKVHTKNFENIYITDGVLDSTPLLDNSVDLLMTSNAIGWNIEEELKEIERIVKPGGQAIHLVRTRSKDADNLLHDKLISQGWGYRYKDYSDSEGIKLKYSKTVK